MSRTKLSASRVYYVFSLVALGVIYLIFDQFSFAGGFVKFIFAVILLAVLFLIFICKKTYFDEEYVYFGRDKVPYDQIIDVSSFGVNEETILYFKVKSGKRYFVSLAFSSFYKIIKALIKRDVNAIPEVRFFSLLEEKGSVPKKRLDSFK